MFFLIALCYWWQNLDSVRNCTCLPRIARYTTTLLNLPPDSFINRMRRLYLLFHLHPKALMTSLNVLVLGHQSEFRKKNCCHYHSLSLLPSLFISFPSFPLSPLYSFSTFPHLLLCWFYFTLWKHWQENNPMWKVHPLTPLLGIRFWSLQAEFSGEEDEAFRLCSFVISVSFPFLKAEMLRHVTTGRVCKVLLIA